MTVRVRLPELEHWKAQVKCQAGMPRPDGRGTIRPAHRRRAERRGLPGGAGAQPLRLGLRPRLRRALRGRLPPRQHRRPHRDPGAQAVRDGAVRRRVPAARYPGPPARGAHPRRQPLPRTPSRRPLHERAARVALEGRGGRGRPGRALGRARPGPARLRRDRLRRRDRAGRDDALRHPRVPPPAHAHPAGDPEDPGPGRDAALGRRPHALVRALRATAATGWTWAAPGLSALLPSPAAPDASD